MRLSRAYFPAHEKYPGWATGPLVFQDRVAAPNPTNPETPRGGAVGGSSFIPWAVNLGPQRAWRVGVGVWEDLSQLGCSWKVLDCCVSGEEPCMDSGGIVVVVSYVAPGRSLSLSELQLPNAQMGEKWRAATQGCCQKTYSEVLDTLRRSKQAGGIFIKTSIGMREGGPSDCRLLLRDAPLWTFPSFPSQNTNRAQT